MSFLFVEARVVRPPWAGSRLARDWGKGAGKIGETWEAMPEALLRGTAVTLGSTIPFPLLVKLLDTDERLSVQVHPNAADAKQRVGAERGKAEAWVVLHAEPEARIAYGLARVLSQAELHDRAASGEIEEDLQWISPRAGDVINVPPGTIHAIGPGLLLYEVQEPADITWRLYDWGRGRPLQLEDACAVANREACPNAFVRRDALRADGPAIDTLLQTEFFVVQRISAGGRWSQSAPGALTAVSGTVRVECGRGRAISLVAGETVVVLPDTFVITGDGLSLLSSPPG